MKTVFWNDIFTTLKQKNTYIALLVYAGIGFMTGYKFSIKVGDAIAANAPYSLGFMIGLMSLMIILMATVVAFTLLFKESDANFGLIVFATPIEKRHFAMARFGAFYILTLFGFFILVMAYALGLYMQPLNLMNPGFQPWHFFYPFLIFGVVNAFLICSLLFFVSSKFQNKLLLAVTGLLLYILYMLAMVFSNAPFMAQALPQSMMAQRMSAIVDVFGLSSYFFEAKDLTVLQRNQSVVPFTNYIVLNRVVVALLAMGIVCFGIRAFSVLPIDKGTSKKDKMPLASVYTQIPFTTASTGFNLKTRWNAIVSFIKIDTIYLFKSIAFIAVGMLLLFYVGMEMYGDIDGGIRMPQLYASSGRLAQTINATFYFMGAFVMVYFVNDMYWRSTATGFSILQNTTYYAKEKLLGHLGSITLLVSVLTMIMIVEALVFQMWFQYFRIDVQAYVGVVVFNMLPVVLLSLLLLFINSISKSKAVALGMSLLVFLLFATPISKSFIANPLLRFLSGYRGHYSEFLGYGPYLPLFLWRWVFGLSIVAMLFLTSFSVKSSGKKGGTYVALFACIVAALVSGSQFLEGYEYKNDDSAVTERVSYEKMFRKYQHIPQPTISEVSTEIDLYPELQRYRIKGHYVMMNKHSQPVDSLLFTIPKDFELISLTYQYKNETVQLKQAISQLFLKEPIAPTESATLEFELAYQWHAVNNHDNFNAIVENGSFMRISRYFPKVGYDSEKEISDKTLREMYKLGDETPLTALEAPKMGTDDFIKLSMQISTPQHQIAVGTGELKKEWQHENRNYYLYTAEDIPFRFAVSSAEYEVKRVQHHGVSIRVLYHPLHDTNVSHLIENTKLTLAYCIENFGPYPFKSITYAEVSSFTQGFAGTAYPGVIFMTEHMTFNANIKAGKNQDVVNELAGHEVAHLWWGTNQIDPDYREGYAMLTESLAMYTEMMVYKKMYGHEQMMERLAIHQQIYDAQKGFSDQTSLLRANGTDTFIAYSKGAVVFVALSELIGEPQLNKALRNFLAKHEHPNPKPIATDVLHEILEVSDKSYHPKIKSLFE
ncbi:aminopeptidase [Subsaxibacter sp. CAU 1640]|uniref:M1 family aminopeptidase n=1 Tax=Subsaxibacter sp. CAU 1640 TaxID=2933271 RepID=UPI00200503BF|nr:M1 family aminopeptidase [Subsaxibacter sp. CAU 1640]MCK7590616.1 aminopeptidase [Subsaxibacter sp. CAU 1640]